MNLIKFQFIVFFVFMVCYARSDKDFYSEYYLSDSLYKYFHNNFQSRKFNLFINTTNLDSIINVNKANKYEIYLDKIKIEKQSYLKLKNDTLTIYPDKKEILLLNINSIEFTKIKPLSEYPLLFIATSCIAFIFSSIYEGIDYVTNKEFNIKNAAIFSAGMGLVCSTVIYFSKEGILIHLK